MNQNKFLIISIFSYSIFIFNFFSQILAKDLIQATETIFSIPTYTLESNNLNPEFWNTRVYPYPMQTNLSNKKHNKFYKIIILENDYIKVYICPDLGGKILAAFDKTSNDFDFIYHNEVIKPAIIGLRGAWTSGGMEWNFPTPGHTVNAFSSVNYKVVKNSDKSISCIVGTEEWVKRMSWQVQITLYPNKSYIQTDIKLSNRTLDPNVAYFWINPATHAFDDTRIIFPNTKYVFNTGSTVKTNWPINNKIDISLYKNTKNPKDYFCASLVDFNGIYNDKKNNGMVHYASKLDSKGKKYWTWGTGFENFKWEHLLTDFNGPYIEIQSGKLQNQSDTWIMEPHILEKWTEWWYPIKNMQGFVKANQNAAINVKQKNKLILVTLNVTSNYNNATVQLLDGSKKSFEEIIDLSPKNTYTKKISLNTKNKKFELKILDNKKNEIISYSTINAHKPLKQIPLKNHTHKEFSSLKQNNYESAIKFLNQSLKENPNVAQSLTDLGIIYYKIGKNTKAYFVLEKSLKINPTQDIAHYYLALSKIKIEKYESAKTSLYQISKNCTFYNVTPYILASLELRKNNYKQAEFFLNKSIKNDCLNIKNKVMLAIVKFHLGKNKQAYKLLNKAMQEEPLDPLLIIGQQLISQKTNLDILRNKPEYYLETALDLLEMNLIKESISTLKIYLDLKTKKQNHPFIHYYLGYLYHKIGNKKLASKYFDSANKCSVNYIFPFRTEDENVLQTALSYNPNEWKTLYYLGTLLTSKSRWEDGLKFFIEAKKFNPNCAILFRNIGIIYWQKLHDHKNAKAMYQKAISLPNNNPDLYIEFDKFLAENKDNTERSMLFQMAPLYVKENLNFMVRKILFYLDINQKQKALTLLKNIGFIPYEDFSDSRLSSLEREAFAPTKNKS